MISIKKSIPVLIFTLVIPVSFISRADTAPAAKETKTLQKLAVNGTNREMGMGISEFPPNALKKKHKALGPEIVYVLDGEVTVWVEGQTKKVVHAGESYKLAASDVHITQAGPQGAKTIASWVTVPGKQFNIYTKKS